MGYEPMKRRDLHAAAVVLGAIAAIAVVGCGGPGYGARGPEPQVAEHIFQATVQGVYVEQRSLDCQMGVGYAIEIVRVEVPADARIADSGRRLRLQDLQRGDVVRVRHRETLDERVVAEWIERIRVRGRGD